MTIPELFLINLDDEFTDPEDLRAYARKLGNFLVKSEEDKRTKTLLIRYANHKVLAMEHRKAGRIHDAFFEESKCDYLYRKLPEEAMW